MKLIALLLTLLLLVNPVLLRGQTAASAQTSAARSSVVNGQDKPNLQELERNIRAQMNFLASDALAGRGSATGFELIAAEYIASQLMGFGIEPAGDADAAGNKTFVQNVAVGKQNFSSAPTLQFSTGNRQVVATHGKEVLMPLLSAPELSGKLQKLAADAKPETGAIVFAAFKATPSQESQRQIVGLLSAGAKVVLVEETPELRQQLGPSLAGQMPRLPNAAPTQRGIVILDTATAAAVRQTADGTNITIKGTVETETIRTRNVVGVIKGGDSKLSQQAVLFSAHLDHIGSRPAEPGKDTIYNGADDDASGVVAVLELARAMARGAKPKRTVYFVCFGSEESGGYGATEFLNRPPTALTNFVANLEFEMIGRPDPKVAADQLWLTGYERSNLGAELARRGAKLVADPHPEQNFFQRSDNYQLAKRGVIAHTVSSFGLHPQYHQPDDDIAHIDFAHMTRAIASMIEPSQWLVNNDFVPVWAEGKKP